MTYLLKLAEALGIPHYMGVELIAEYPCLYRTVCSKGLGFRYVTDDSDDGFIFDLTGPDAGNTRWEIEKILVEKGWFMRQVFTMQKIYEIELMHPEKPYHYYGSSRKGFTLALREAAAKALGVER